MSMTVLAVLLAALASHLAVTVVPRPPTRRTGHRLPRWLRPRADALGWRTRLLAGGGAGLVAYLLIEPVGPPLALAGGVLLGAGVVVALGHLEPPTAQRLRAQRVQDLPEAVDLLAACLASGLPLRRAVREVAAVTTGPVGDDLTSVVRLVDVGAGERSAWLALARRPGWTAIGRDIARASESGTGLQNVLAHHGEHARRNAQAARQQRARTLGVRSVWPLMLCFLPAFVFLGIVPTVGSMVQRMLQLE